MTTPPASFNASIVIGEYPDPVAQSAIVIGRIARSMQNIFWNMRRSLRVWNARLDERTLMRLTASSEEIPQQRAGFGFGDPAVNFGLVVARWR